MICEKAMYEMWKKENEKIKDESREGFRYFLNGVCPKCGDTKNIKKTQLFDDGTPLMSKKESKFDKECDELWERLEKVKIKEPKITMDEFHKRFPYFKTNREEFEIDEFATERAFIAWCKQKKKRDIVTFFECKKCKYTLANKNIKIIDATDDVQIMGGRSNGLEGTSRTFVWKGKK